MELDSRFFMELALKEAWKYQGLTYPNPAVGCCVVGEHNEILAVEAHRRAGEPHAEVNALQKAFVKLSGDDAILSLQSSEDIHNYLLKNHNNIFHKCSVYSTLEPCSHRGKTPSCANLLSALGVKKVFVGAKDFNKEAAQGIEILQKSSVEVEDSLCEKECRNLLLPFKKYLDSQFVFFKWAQRLNGTFDGGTISCEHSRKHVHSLRDRCDLLIIGGNTVRIDRPTLDARLVGGKAPDVLIISREKEFDRSIPLFHVEGRKVFIADDFSIIKNYKNIMIEGGESLFSLTKGFVDFYLCYVAPKFGGIENFSNSQERFEVLNADQVDEDIIIWMKRED
ncbi:MAG: bifunctional diaminohydroxyphosphoribosylaminopyrimidine deaminase/5-amino-6-(5-phosphoribosylamino)uracil reductase RibD [Sulfurimonas sp.]